MPGKTLYKKIWDSHVIPRDSNQSDLLFIDLHLIHEVTSPQAFEGLRIKGLKVLYPDLTLATADHNVPTANLDKPIEDAISKIQLETLSKNCSEFKIRVFPMGHLNQGIVHVIGPELGLTLPGMTIVCGDSHTATHGAFGALAFGIGTSEVEHVLASQTLAQSESKTMAINLKGMPSKSAGAKDVILAIIGKIGTGGGLGHVIEYRGAYISAISMEERMTICNMSIEAGARAGMIAPDDTTFSYIENREYAPKGKLFEEALNYWKSLATDEDAQFDKTIEIDLTDLSPMVSWGTNPAQVAEISAKVPDPSSFGSVEERRQAERALEYMGLEPGKYLKDIKIDTVFIGSCTNSRISDLEAAADVIKGRKVAKGVRALVVPGSRQVKLQAEAKGLDKVFIEAGFEWREPGCSMCLAMNPDKLRPQERAISTSNRNFEGRQGKGGRTHLASPKVAAATAILGHIAEPDDLE